jgi:hypothetical protein
VDTEFDVSLLELFNKKVIRETFECKGEEGKERQAINVTNRIFII